MLAHGHDGDDRRLRQDVADVARREKNRRQKTQHDDQSDQDKRRANAEQRQSDVETGIGRRPRLLRDGPGAFMPIPALSPASDKFSPPPNPQVSAPRSLLDLLSIDKRQRTNVFASSCFLCIKIVRKRHPSGTAHEAGHRLQEGAQRDLAIAWQRRVRCRVAVRKSAARPDRRQPHHGTQGAGRAHHARHRGRARRRQDSRPPGRQGRSLQRTGNDIAQRACRAAVHGVDAARRHQARHTHQRVGACPTVRRGDQWHPGISDPLQPFRTYREEDRIQAGSSRDLRRTSRWSCSRSA